MKIHFERESIQQKQNSRINSSAVVMKKIQKKTKKNCSRKIFREKPRQKKQITKETE